MEDRLLPFREIKLSSDEVYALKKIDEEIQVYAGVFSDLAIFQLEHHRFISTYVADVPDGENVTFHQIESRGHDYLMFYKGAEQERKTRDFHFLVTTFISILALVLSTIALAKQLGLLG